MLDLLVWVIVFFMIGPLYYLEFWLLGKGYKPAVLIVLVNITIHIYTWYRIIWASQPKIEGLTGTILSGVGIIFIGVSIILFAKAGHLPFGTKEALELKPKELITTGPYKIVRHPVYLAFFLSILGVALWQRSMWAILLSPSGLLLVFLGAMYEEVFVLKKVLPSQLAAYKRQVPMLLPVPLMVVIIVVYLTVGLYYLTY